MELLKIFPDDCIVSIFKFLTMKELLSIKLTCKRFNTLSWKSFDHTEGISYSCNMGHLSYLKEILKDKRVTEKMIEDGIDCACEQNQTLIVNELYRDPRSSLARESSYPLQMAIQEKNLLLLRVCLKFTKVKIDKSNLEGAYDDEDQSLLLELLNHEKLSKKITNVQKRKYHDYIEGNRRKRKRFVGC